MDRKEYLSMEQTDRQKNCRKNKKHSFSKKEIIFAYVFGSF